MSTQDTEAQVVEFSALREELFAAARQAPERRTVRSVHGGDDGLLRQTALALLEGAELPEHDRPPEATLQVLHGRIRLSAEGRDWELSAGEFLEIPNARHSVTALEDSLFLVSARLPIPAHAAASSTEPAAVADAVDQPDEQLPFAARRAQDAPGHWLLARLGKRVLRPGGLGLTRRLVEHARVSGADVVELAPGLGRTATELLAAGPRSYVGVEKDADAARLTERAIGTAGRIVNADAADSGLPDASADVVLGEAMLTMQSEAGKQRIVAEAARVLRPGGRYAIHELGLSPDTLAPEVKTALRKDLARSIKVNARPLTLSEWTQLLEGAGLRVEWSGAAPMALLQMRRNLADEGVRGTARILGNVARDADARRRVLAMRALFREHRDRLRGVALVAVKPENPTR